MKYFQFHKQYQIQMCYYLTDEHLLMIQNQIYI